MPTGPAAADNSPPPARRTVLFVLQGGYLVQLFSSNLETVNAAAAVGSHFILNNLLHFAFVMLFVINLIQAWARRRFGYV